MRGDLRVEIGGVARAHGIRGEVVIVTHDPDSEILGRVGTIYVGGVERTVAGAREATRGWLVQLAGITTRTEAETLRGKPVEVDRDAVADGGDDEVMLSDLVGCKVVLADGTPWGVVASIDAGFGQDRLVIHHDGFERMVPLVDELVPNIDLEAGIVTVDPPEGLPKNKLPEPKR